MVAIRLIVVVVVALGGALAGVGCALSALFEIQGFGGPRDTDPRPAYVALCGLGLLASVLIPLGVWRLLLPETAPAIGWLAFAAAVVVVLALLGVAAAR